MFLNIFKFRKGPELERRVRALEHLCDVHSRRIAAVSNGQANVVALLSHTEIPRLAHNARRAR